jgi:hypothetical protein
MKCDWRPLFLALIFPLLYIAQESKAESPTSPASAPTDRPRRPLRAIAVSIHEPRKLEAYEKCIDEIAAVGADAVQIVVTNRQEQGSSTWIAVDVRYAPSREQLLRLLAYAKSKKLRTILQPLIILQSPRGNEWRGTVKPDSWEEWFISYREMMTYYADIAAEARVDVLIVGTELVASECLAAEWTKTIAAVRARYKGLLTYSANWDHYDRNPFWEQLDLIAMNSYWKLGDDRDVTVEETVRRWRVIQKDLFPFLKAKGKPLMLTEVGYASLANAAHEPWDYTRVELKADWDLQRRLYEGFFQAWHGEPLLAGFSMWEWHPYPKGKPAERVLREWLGKGGWEVR